MSEFLSMKETAIGIHEYFSSLLDAGFTREEALELVKVVLGGQK